MRRLLLAVCVAVSSITAASRDAGAAPILDLQDVGGAVGITVLDQGPGDFSATAGRVLSLGSVGQFSVGGATVTSMPLIAGIDLSLQVDTPAAGTFKAYFADTGFSGGFGVANLLSQIGGTFTAPAGSTITVQTWVNPGNTSTIPPPASGSIAGMSAVFGPGLILGLTNTNFDQAGPYALFGLITVNFLGPGRIGFDLDLQGSTAPGPAPLLECEPGSMLAWGLGMCLVGATGCWKRRRNRP